MGVMVGRGEWWGGGIKYECGNVITCLWDIYERSISGTIRVKLQREKERERKRQGCDHGVVAVFLSLFPCKQHSS